MAADLQTKLSYFLTDLWAGTLGVKQAITTLLATTSVSTPTHIVTGTYGTEAVISTVTLSLATTGGAGTVATTTTPIPASSLVFGVVTRVTTIIAGGGIASYSVGDGTDADRWGAGILVAANTVSGVHDFTTAPAYYPHATNITLTANAGNFTSGAIRISIYYMTMASLTS